MNLMCVAPRVLVLLVFVSSCMLGFSLAASAVVENLARGGNFEDDEDLAEWMLDIADGSLGEMDIDDTTAAVDKCSLFFKIEQLSGNDSTRPRFNQVGHLIEKGKKYTFAAFYKAEEKRGAIMAVQMDVGPWTLFVEKTIVIGTEWEEKWAEFTAPMDSAVSLQPTRNNGSTGNYWVDGVRFFEGGYEPYDFGQKAVSAVGKLAVRWGAVRSLY